MNQPYVNPNPPTYQPATYAPDMAGVNVLLMGPAGTGKTHSIGTVVEAGLNFFGEGKHLEVFYLALEPGLESLKGYFTDFGKTIPANLHWHTIKAPKIGFADMIESAKMINTLSLESLAKMTDPKRSQHNQFVSILEALANFPCDRTNQKFGAVNEWGPERMLIVDGMAGLGKASMAMVVGGKPVRSQSDWGMAQDQVEKLVRKLAEDCKCHFVLLGHVERETDQVLGGVKIMISTLGAKLAPKLPPLFSDIILTTRQGTKWTWDTSNSQADLKTRNLPIAADNPPTFAPVLAKWLSRARAE
jgi:hypothetical protein